MQSTNINDNLFLNNYINNNFESFLIVSYDVVNVSLLMSIEELSTFTTKLSLHTSSSKSIRRPTDNSLAIIYKVQYNSKEYTLTLNDRSKPFKPYILNIQHPDIHIFTLLNDLLKGFDYHIQLVEISFDFHSNKNNEIYQFLKRHLHVKWDRSPLNLSHETCCYKSNPRTSVTKGSRIYLKSVDNQEFVRFEMDLKRPLLKRFELYNLNHLINFDMEIITSFVELKEFDEILFGRRFFDNPRNTQADYFKVIKNINNIIESNGVSEANKYAKEVVKYSSLRTHKSNNTFANYINDLSIFGNNMVTIDPDCFVVYPYQ